MAMDRETLYRIGMYGATVLVGVTTSTLAFPTAVAIAGTSLSGVIGGMLANELGALNNNGNPDLRNAHLTRATGNAIAIVIRTVAKEAQGGRCKDFFVVLEALATTAETKWESISQEILQQDNLAELDEKQLAELYFSKAAPDFASLKALAKAEDWLPVLEKLREKTEKDLPKGFHAYLRTIDTQDFDHLALELHNLFPKAIREELKKDFAQGKEAFAGMIFDLLGNLTQEVKAIRNSSDFSDAEAKELNAMLEQLQQYEKREKKQFKDLAEQVNAVLDSVIQEIAKAHEQTRATIQQEHKQTRETVEQQHEITRKQTQDALEQGFTRLGDKIDKIDPKRPISAHPPTNLGRYRRPVAKFVGRETAISELSELLQSSETVAIAAAVSGMGGLGKTELAWQWAQQQYDLGNFPGGVVWLDMAAGNPGEQLILFCQTEFAVELPDFPTLVERIAYCWQHWQEWRTGEVLIVLDDVARDRDADKLQWFQPGKSQFRVLWTTREQWTGIKQYPLDKLSEAAARELLASYLEAKWLENEPEAVAQLLAWFEGLPLGLELAARYLALDEFLPIADYVRELSLTHESLENNIEMPYPHGVEAALALSWARLADAEARDLALRLGLYGAAPIPLTNEQQTAWRKPLRQLTNLHLLEREAKDLVRLHPLVRQFFQAQLAVELSSEEGDELRREVAGVIVDQGQQIPYSFTMAQAREFASWIPHLEEVAEVLLPWVADEDVIEPCNRIAMYYLGQGLYITAEPWSQQCLAVARERLGNQHSKTAAALNNLAGLYKSQRKYSEAEPLYSEALIIVRESLPLNHTDLATFLNNLANLYKSQGKYSQAESLYTEAIAIDRKSLPPNHPDLASSLNGFAELYRLQGKYNEAEPLYSEALVIARESLPPNHPRLASHLSSLAALYYSQGKYSEAEPLYSEALAIDRESLPPNHPDLASHLSSLAALYYSQGKYSEAEPLYSEALAIDRESLPPNHPDLASHLSSLAALYYSQGKYSE
ncbi:MAG: tetratricopeptide repeat protein, partial [Jaaginema sp. PMC 1080.18]|nr:tetratricopeptide repeat protein [Jaaginema sp. PMC 1080.18]